jgi:hypothetical protein
VTRVGVALPRATAGEGVDAASLAETVRHTMLKYLKGPAIETIMLDARLPAQIDLEARRKECDYVVHSTVTHKKGSGGFGSLLKKAAPVVDVMPVGSTAGAVASAAARAVVYTAAELSGSLKARDELTLEYELRAPGGSSSGPRTLKAKARSDGEDIISPLVEQAARAVLAEAVKR